MLSSLFRPSLPSHRCTAVHRGTAPSDRQPRESPNSINRQRNRHESFNSFGEDEASTDEVQSEEQNSRAGTEEDYGSRTSQDSEDGVRDDTPLLPMFSRYLDALPVFNITRAIREMVVLKCESVLSWDQLRSPQVSQFLLKPIEQEIRSKHFNAATEYALIANCLQFNKEIALYPGNSGTSRTRAMVCELLAIRILREYTSRDLIDALSYDFDPFQGQGDTVPSSHRTVSHRAARISCYEVALRAQAKRFLAHPLVVQQLEAIWAGTIVFHSAADSMHRQSRKGKQLHNYNTISPDHPRKVESYDDPIILRRAVTIYNPRDASVFKLSRLRVPRYRNILSTMSFAVLLVLFLAVLIRRSVEITTLEVIFWFWAAGYMLDEIVGFTEQGFGLYIASFWNTFDLGILLMLFLHLCLRLYGVIMPDVRKHTIANMAYDVLAADAILLFPRLFSVLDHYRYFSQLLIAFRMMAQDLVAVFLLILISCSGFFVALSFSFGNDDVDTPSSVAYALLQMIMGFTPAAWDRWEAYNVLGKTILTLFLFICHFLVVTILITVLTNSFMAIVQNANEEHQFVFAVNTISNVKSDALFSYIAPANVIQWTLTPLRYVIPFRQYVKVNRTIIKVIHFPILLAIYVYERTALTSSTYGTTDTVEGRGRNIKSYTTKLNRDPSIGTVRQDRALDEVFKQPYDSTMRSPEQSRTRRKASNVVGDWMRKLSDQETDLARRETAQDGETSGRKHVSRRKMRQSGKPRDLSGEPMSIASDPYEFASNAELVLAETRSGIVTPLQIDTSLQNTDIEADEEAVTTNIVEEGDAAVSDQQSSSFAAGVEVPLTRPLRPFDYFIQHQSPRLRPSKRRSSSSSQEHNSIPSANRKQGKLTQSFISPQRREHLRNVSSATMIYKPILDMNTEKGSSSPSRAAAPASGQAVEYDSGIRTPISKSASVTNSQRIPRRAVPGLSRIRPIYPGKENTAFQSAPNLAALANTHKRSKEVRRHPSLEMDLVSDLGDNKAIGGGYVGAIPASFATQMFHASKMQQRKEEQDMFGRLMMARMNSLEEGFREVIHEMRESITNRPESVRSQSGSKERTRRPTGRKSREKRSHDVSGRSTPLKRDVLQGDGQENNMGQETYDSTGVLSPRSKS